MSLVEHVIGTVKRMQEPLGFEGWSIQVQHGPIPDAKAGCEAQPEYKRMTLTFDLDKLETGDELDEIIAHELSHAHTWPIWDLAEDLMALAVGMMPEATREPLVTAWSEQIRRAGEDCTTQVGFTAIRLLRRLWKAEDEVRKLRKQVRALDKATKSG